jgi:hypothetical protein
VGSCTPPTVQPTSTAARAGTQKYSSQLRTWAHEPLEQSSVLQLIVPLQCAGAAAARAPVFKV